MTFVKIDYVLFFVFICLACISCKKEHTPVLKGNVHLNFIHEVNGQPLLLADKQYTNRAGNNYRVEKIKYYMSNIELVKADGAVTKIPDSYYLIEETGLDKRTLLELKNVPVATYASLSFMIGVDSARNFSTEMVGDLNPNSDMAWNWVSGYKFLLLEGKFITPTQATGALVYHIGGNSSLRRITFNSIANGLPVQAGKTSELGIGADINQIFDSKNSIDLNQTNAVMQPGLEASKIADNYSSGMFRLHHIQVK
jgi:hypothetical protein